MRRIPRTRLWWRKSGADCTLACEANYNAVMWKRAVLASFLLPGILAGQIASSDRTITITASRNANVPPDQALFAVYVLSPTDSSRDEVLAAVQGSGITVANL